MRATFTGVLVLSVLSASTAAQSLVLEVRGAAKADQFAATAASAGDVDKDGVPDLVVGAKGSDAKAPNAGLVQVLSGKDAKVLHAFLGDAAGDWLGHAVGGAGDVNADGHADLIVAAQPAAVPGWARVLSGKDGTTLYTFSGPTLDERFAIAVAGTGDVNADGFADLAVGSDYGKNGGGVTTGLVRVFSGKDGTLLFLLAGSAAGDRFGCAVARAGDCNQDGYADVVVGAMQPDGNGYARLVSGKDGTVLFTWPGKAKGDLFGFAVAGGADVDRDGVPDVMVGAPSGGYAQALSGKDGKVVRTVLSADAATRFGAAVALADANGDRHADLVVGAGDNGRNGGGAGAVVVFSGFDGQAILTAYGDRPGDNLGSSVAAAGDLNGDGFEDVLAGAPQCPLFLCETGYVRVYSTKLVNPPQELYRLSGAGAGDAFGGAVARAGDADGDGHADFAVGSPGHDGAGAEAGLVQSFAGATGLLRHAVRGNAAGDRFGAALSEAGDVDKDGRPDLVAGAPGGAYAKVLSGRDGGTVHTVSGSGDFGHAVSGVGDLDADGYADFAVGAPAASLVRIFSGRDGQVLRALQGTVGDRFGFALAGCGDVDKDGVPDVVVGAPEDGGDARTGSVRVFSGKDGSVLHAFAGDATGELFGYSVSGAGDVDGDGHADLLLGAPLDLVGDLVAGGSVQVRSGRTGALLYRHPGTTSFARVGLAVSEGGDLDRDGAADYLIGARTGTAGQANGSVTAYSGRTGKALYAVNGSRAQAGFGEVIDSLGDVNRDGFPDLVAGEPRGGEATPSHGAALVLSGRPSVLSADTGWVSISRVGTGQTLTLDLGPAHAGKIYLVLGSLSGTWPGLRINAVTIPINLDAYSSFLLGAPNSIVQGSLGVILPTGVATARFTVIPRIPKTLAPGVMHHAFVVFSRDFTRIEFASNAIALELRP